MNKRAKGIASVFCGSHAIASKPYSRNHSIVEFKFSGFGSSRKKATALAGNDLTKTATVKKESYECN
ncbi:hypothetical protein QWY15_12955 [Planococcus sp. N064]|uniref:Uncharacterized protein n=1 Tax=Planococcus liqunii TaxID=3058394 RepID=A0ABT8MTU2_9BACL|nr:hypothetical protein [Planococcus sp. N064]MDN7228208.1 hypothetical protein [Planococcus sp. N064]